MEKQTRSTRQRKIILEELRSVSSHPTADELYVRAKSRLPNISLGTVYRNLDLLVQKGEVVCLETAGLQRRFDGDTTPHYHVRCRKCGKVQDLPGEFRLPDIPSAPLNDFTVTGVRVEFEGICSSCAGPRA